MSRGNVNFTRIEVLSSGVFAGLSELRWLNLGSNELSALPENVFAGLSKGENLFLANQDLSELAPGAFAGLSGLDSLFIGNAGYDTLPPGVFVGLTSLESILLDGNPVDRFEFELTLEQVGDDRFKAVVPDGAPFALELPLSIGSGGAFEGGADTITIPAGAAESASMGIVRTDADIDSATVDIGTLPFLPRNHSGYVLQKGATLPLEIPLPEELVPPAQVTGVGIARGGASLRVSWLPVSGADGYKVQWKSGDEAYDDETRQAVVVRRTRTSRPCCAGRTSCARRTAHDFVNLPELLKNTDWLAAAACYDARMSPGTHMIVTETR